MRALVGGLVLAGVLAGGAAAEGGFMSGRAARATFFGMDMGGVHEPDGARWRECINRRGDTQYWYGQRVDQGKLTVSEDGALCFSYASTNFREASCWRARDLGHGAYRFEPVNGGHDAFIAQRTRRVSNCGGADTPVA